MSRDEEKARPHRRWQFSLRSLLLLMLLVATFFSGWKASDWYREWEQAETQEGWVIELRGYIYHQQVKVDPIEVQYFDDLSKF